MDGLSSDFRRLMDRFQQLTPAEERELFLRYGDDRRRIEESLVLHNLKLAKCIASRYKGHKGESEADLFTIAVIGLVKAAREFDPSRGARFPTFAYYKIRSALSVLTNDCLVDVKMQKATDTVLDAPASAFTDDEDGDRSFGESTMLREAHDYLPPAPGRVYADAMESRECEELVRKIDRRYLSREDPRNRRIVLGILRGEVQSAIARELGISREAERVRAKAAMARLRKALRREGCKWR